MRTIQMKLSMLLMRMVKELWICGWAAPFLNNIMLRSALGREN